MSLTGGVSDGQDANENTFDNAFMKSNSDTGTIGKMDLQDPDSASGADIINTQKEINNLYTFLGAIKNQVIGLLPTWANNNGLNSNDDVRDRADALSAKFHETTGHAHTGAAGDGPQIDSSDLANVPLRGYPQQGQNIPTPGTNSTDVSTIMTGKIASSGSSVKGVVVTAPYNKVPLFVLTGAEANDFLQDALGNHVYGRLTESAGVWTLTTYVDLSGVETAYALTAGQISDGIKWFYQELFSPIVDAPIYDELFFVQSDNATADVVDATSTQRGLMSTLAQSFSGLKTFLNSISANNLNIFDVADPTAATHAANMKYVDEFGKHTAITGAAGTTTLSSSSNKKIVVLGTLGETIELPSTATLQQGELFVIVNNGTAGTVTVKDFGGANTLAVLEIIHMGIFWVSSTGAETWSSSKVPRISIATGNLNMGSGKIINLADPTNAQDAATKNYVDTTAGGSSFSDAAFEVTDDGDATKKFKLQVSGVATGTTRTMTVPDVDFTPVTVASSQVITGNKQFQDIAIITNPLDLNSGQIAFPPTANPSANANTLDDYEEGTWTPVDINGGLSLGSPSGVYTKIGNMVYWGAYFAIPVTASTATNLIGGLPFTSALGDENRSANVGYSNKGVAFTVLNDPGSTAFRFYGVDGSTKIYTELSNGSYYLSGFYRI